MGGPLGFIPGVRAFSVPLSGCCCEKAVREIFFLKTVCLILVFLPTESREMPRMAERKGKKEGDRLLEANAGVLGGKI